jgi:hypothetical protein
VSRAIGQAKRDREKQRQREAEQREKRQRIIDEGHKRRLRTIS